MSVFLGEVGLWIDDCAGDRRGACLRGEGGATEDAAPFVGAEALAMVVDATLKAPVRNKLWRREGTDALAAVLESFVSPLEFGRGCLFGGDSPRKLALLSVGWSFGSLDPLPSSRTAVLFRCGRRVLARLEVPLCFAAAPSTGEGLDGGRVLSVVDLAGGLVVAVVAVFVSATGRAILEDCDFF